MDSLDVSLSAEAWERPLAGTVCCFALCSRVVLGGAWQWWTVAGLGMVCTWWKEGWEMRKRKEDENQGLLSHLPFVKLLCFPVVLLLPGS